MIRRIIILCLITCVAATSSFAADQLVFSPSASVSLQVVLDNLEQIIVDLYFSGVNQKIRDSFEKEFKDIKNLYSGCQKFRAAVCFDTFGHFMTYLYEDFYNSITGRGLITIGKETILKNIEIAYKSALFFASYAGHTQYEFTQSDQALITTKMPLAKVQNEFMKFF